jgi:hypothetical protein
MNAKLFRKKAPFSCSHCAGPRWIDNPHGLCGGCSRDFTCRTCRRVQIGKPKGSMCDGCKRDTSSRKDLGFTGCMQKLPDEIMEFRIALLAWRVEHGLPVEGGSAEEIHLLESSREPEDAPAGDREA